MDASKYETVMNTISNIQVCEYENFNGIQCEGKSFVFIMSTRFHVTGSSRLSCGRVVFPRGHELLPLTPRRY